MPNGIVSIDLENKKVYVVADGTAVGYQIVDSFTKIPHGIKNTSTDSDLYPGDKVTFKIRDDTQAAFAVTLIPLTDWTAMALTKDHPHKLAYNADKAKKAEEAKARQAARLLEEERLADEMHKARHAVYIKLVRMLRTKIEDAGDESQFKESQTLCIMADDKGDEMYFGHSTWKAKGKNDLGKQAYDDNVIRLVPNASREFDAAKHQFGTACAEVECLYYRALKPGAAMPIYCLAYDQPSKRSKKACTNCATMLSKNNIIDLYPYRSGKRPT